MKKNQHWFGISFSVGFLLLLGAFVYFRSNQIPLEVQNASLNDLKSALEKDGIEAFRAQKALLKRKIAFEITHTVRQPRATNNVAVYLFPDVLPETNMEKETAQELWGDHWNQIDAHPHTEAARELFEDARSNIWSYEAADKENPRTTEEARQIMSLYETLSAP